eukprot:CAMPEP_0174378616 /NCGR_PEP_ID=MMETSP0811_2-20130205/122159_1 /TAXON_ID=73025 ORGANISM="Eutreptiella gymnastica-like, Strain CCMP1594" /NCGR_SAMPLE_ID=MMETSP0811_2 /ASSEMBLY_ACC=CAM_ASM_000667 /LENGTH=135 /DNA_ID=CAMNT_0015530879 /DNA_START=2148 /DNA_END=2552 /DNA_ORIENTATION=-
MKLKEVDSDPLGRPVAEGGQRVFTGISAAPLNVRRPVRAGRGRAAAILPPKLSGGPPCLGMERGKKPRIPRGAALVPVDGGRGVPRGPGHPHAVQHLVLRAPDGAGGHHLCHQAPHGHQQQRQQERGQQVRDGPE